jgi:hypothetical protein
LPAPPLTLNVENMILRSSVSKPASLELGGSAIMPAFGRTNYADEQTRRRWRS